MSFRTCRFVFAFFCFSTASLNVMANQLGQSGASGSPHTNNGRTCVECHARDNSGDAVLVLEGPEVVEANQTYEYILRLTGGSARTAGVNVSVDYFDGELQTQDSSLKRLANDLTHARPLPFQNGEAIFKFRWKAPAYNATTGIYAAANSSNGNLDLAGDSIAAANLQVRVQNGSGTRPLDTEPTATAVSVRRVAFGIDSAVGMANAGDSRLFVISQPGEIKIVQGSTILPQSFLDIRSRVTYDRGEQGLLGLAFHPAYANNGYFYVYYTIPSGSAWRARVSRFKVSANRDVADAGSETVLLEFDRPGKAHNGGDLKFGRDGLLYIASGDAAQKSNSQDTNNLLGKILRIDVNNPPAASNQPDCGLNASGRYRIPAGNAFNNGRGGGCDEIYVMGLRNPWRISFDRQTADLWIGDVGARQAEEINFITGGTSGGLNLGWPCFEGLIRDSSVAGCDGQYVSPIHTYYGETIGKSITGGFVYRGNRFPGLRGRYFFSDFEVSRFINTLVRGPDGWQKQQVWNGTNLTGISSFGEGSDGELYVVTRGAGEVYAIEDAGGSGTTPSLSVSSVFATEGLNDIVRINVRLSESSSRTVSVSIRTVAGTATASADYESVTRRLIFNPGERTQSVDIKIVDDNNVEQAESFEVRLSAPDGGTIATGTALVRIDDDDTVDRQLPVLSVADVQVTEGTDSIARVQVRLTPAPESVVSVNVATTQGTATAPADYTETVRQLNFNRGQTIRNFDVAIRNDQASEAAENFQVRLRQANGATIGRAAATVTIRDDDATSARPTLSLSSATVTEGVNNIARVRVQLSAASSEAVSVDVRTVPGSATVPNDYTGVSKRLTFSPGAIVRNVDIVITNDQIRESTESLSVQLSRATGADIATAQATVTINDDDAGGGSQLQITATSLAVTEGVDDHARVTLRLSEPATTAVSVLVQSEPVSAVESSDYIGVQRTLNFNPGQRQRDFDIAIVDDDVAEPSEQFQIRLRQVVGAVAESTVIPVVINDNDASSVSRRELQLKAALKRKVDGMAKRLARLDVRNFVDGPSRTKFMVMFRSLRNATRSGSLALSSEIAFRMRVRIDGCGARPDANDFVVSCDQQLQLRQQNNEIRITLRDLKAL